MLIYKNTRIKNYSENMTDEELVEFCALNKELRIERDKHRNIIIMEPAGGSSGYFETEASGEICIWTKKNRKGIAFNSNTGFLLPNGAMRSPDGCWISDERWQTVPDDQKDKFLPVVPDFIVEIRSPSDNLSQLQEKMEEWRENGARLAWLIDPEEKQVFIYRENGSMEHKAGLDGKLSGEGIMPGFEFDLKLLRMP
jgi:Uma2 family endonuclease